MNTNLIDNQQDNKKVFLQTLTGDEKKGALITLDLENHLIVFGTEGCCSNNRQAECEKLAQYFKEKSSLKYWASFSHSALWIQDFAMWPAILPNLNRAYHRKLYFHLCFIFLHCTYVKQ